MKKKIVKNYHYRESGLEYIFIEKVEVEDTEFGDAIKAFPKDLHKKISILILKSNRPIRGKEVIFFRKALKMGQSDLSTKLGIANSTLASWEKKYLDQPLDKPVQAFLRACFLKMFGEKKVELDFLLDSEVSEKNKTILIAA
ncbi:MAG: hypothetical protein ACOYL6_11570 [Bacteriovoracaceae bacterium]